MTKAESLWTCPSLNLPRQSPTEKVSLISQERTGQWRPCSRTKKINKKNENVRIKENRTEVRKMLVKQWILMQRCFTALVSIRVIHFVPAEAGVCEDRDHDTRAVMSPEPSDEGPCDKSAGAWGSEEGMEGWRKREGGADEWRTMLWQICWFAIVCCGWLVSFVTRLHGEWLSLKTLKTFWLFY